MTPRTNQTDDRPDPWTPAPYPREELAAGLLAGRVAGEVTSHDRHNVRWKAQRLVAGEPDLQFGLTGLEEFSTADVLALMGGAAGFPPEPARHDDPVPIDPHLVLDAMEAAGRRLALAAERGERVLLATGHPVGLILLYQAVGELLIDGGAKLLRPAEGVTWHEWEHRREVRYLRGVAVLTDRASALHTHRPDAMERMLAEVSPDLVFADHGFAGAAIEAGVDTLSIADINDPALVLAASQGRAETVIVMDDNVQPEDYWPCFQAVAARFS